MIGQELKETGLKSGQVWHDIRWIQMVIKQMTTIGNEGGGVLYLKVRKQCLMPSSMAYGEC